MVNEHANERINSRKKIFLDTSYHYWLVGWLVGCFFSIFFLVHHFAIAVAMAADVFVVQFSILFVMIYFLLLVCIFRSPSLMFNVHASKLR